MTFDNINRRLAKAKSYKLYSTDFSTQLFVENIIPLFMHL